MLLSDKDSSLSLVTKHMIRTVVETVSGHKVTILDPTDEYKTFVASVNNYVPSTSDFKSVIEQLKNKFIMHDKMVATLNIIFLSPIWDNLYLKAE